MSSRYHGDVGRRLAWAVVAGVGVATVVNV